VGELGWSVRKKGSGIAAAIELAAILLATAAAFCWGRRTAVAERGLHGLGGEYLLLLLPVVYYLLKQTVWDWVQDIVREGRAAKES